jgi:hypothetical protein
MKIATVISGTTVVMWFSPGGKGEYKNLFPGQVAVSVTLTSETERNEKKKGKGKRKGTGNEREKRQAEERTSFRALAEGVGI